MKTDKYYKGKKSNTNRTLRFTHAEVERIADCLEAAHARQVELYKEMILVSPGARIIWDDICHITDLANDIRNGRKDV